MSREADSVGVPQARKAAVGEPSAPYLLRLPFFFFFRFFLAMIVS